MTGIDYVDEKIALPLQWVSIGRRASSPPLLVWFGRWLLAPAIVPVALLVQVVVPARSSRLST